MSRTVTPAARALWQVTEPLHALVYFAPEVRDAFENAGLHGFWRGYFAGRAAPMGAARAGVVTATFFGFAPAFVARAVPDVWSMIEPDAAVDVRLAGVEASLTRVGVAAFDAWEVRLVVDAARRAFDACDPAGRPLFAANRELAWPTAPHLALWHAATLLREHRGDGHVVALTAGGLDACEAHLTQIAAAGAGIESIAPYRGWNDDDWAGAAENLRARGWFDADGHLTPTGRDARAGVERDTDRLASSFVTHLGAEGVEAWHALLQPLARRIAATGAIPYPNPIGVPPLA